MNSKFAQFFAWVRLKVKDNLKQLVALLIAVLTCCVITFAFGMYAGLSGEQLLDWVLTQLFIVFVPFILVGGFLTFVLPPMLTDAQRYGIDENGRPNKPK